MLLSAALLAGAAGAGEVPAGAPERVVSINLCTDQLAMMLAAPGQLVSVSYLARDVRSSAMAAQAEAFAINRSRTEEIYLLEPDLVLGGTFSTPGTVSMQLRLVRRRPASENIKNQLRTIKHLPLNHLLDLRDLLGR